MGGKKKKGEYRIVMLIQLFPILAVLASLPLLPMIWDSAVLSF